MAAADHGEGVRGREDRAAPRAMVTVCLPALIRSASTSSSRGMAHAQQAFSDCNMTSTLGNVIGRQGGDAYAQVDVVADRGIPGPRWASCSRVNAMVWSYARAHGALFDVFSKVPWIRRST